MRRLPAMTALLLALALVTGCGDDEPSAGATIPVTPEVTEAPDPRLRVELQARARSTDPWAQAVQARPRQLVRFRMTIRNLGEVASRARIRVEPERGLGLVGPSTYLHRTAGVPSVATPLEPGLTRQGVVVDAIAPGTARVRFSMRVAATADVKSRLTVGASVSSQMRRAADTAVVRVVRP